MVTWDIRRDGRAWGDEAMSRYHMTPEKTEMVGGRLYGTEEERLTMLALLLENVGADKAVPLGNASTWRDAIAALNEEHEDQETEAPVLPEAERHALEAARLAYTCSTRRSKRFWTHRPTIGVSKTLFTGSIIRASKYSGFSSRPTPSFGCS